ncbi:MAG TPA: RAMP superfamily CRISPR-associated protein [Thermoanaerobaculia bacterium]|nr:RAMP superfamily CRISPR-associated protein [Thermoanaerobaculia bacterium]
MFSRQLNQIRIDLSLTPRAPLLIRSGRKGADPTRPELECVRTEWGGVKSVYIPGSSLKGVMRSHAERLLLSEDVLITGTFNDKREFNQRTPGMETYAGSSPLGRTFGNLYLKGHVAVSDHLPGAHDPEGSAERQRQVEQANAVEQRNGVAIDRLLGSAAGKALFDQELVVQGRFDGQVVFRNVQLYQLALVLLVLRDLDEGYVQLGSGTTRGNGWVRATVRQLVIETRQGKSAPGILRGAGALGNDLATYGLFGGDEMALPAGIETKDRLIWKQTVVEAGAVDALAEALVAGPWASFLNQARGKTWQA